VPKPYLAKIINSLARQGLVLAKRSSGGGISLMRSPEEISLLQIVDAVEGKGWLGDCLLGLDECSSPATCPTHDFWQRIRGEITEELRKTTLAEVIAFKESHKPKRARSPRGKDCVVECGPRRTQF
jgi:Rrf2 family protein